jgi:hypothetical protein
MILSILIPISTAHTKLSYELTKELSKQCSDFGVTLETDIEILTCRSMIDTNGVKITTGRKRNELLQSAKGEYVCFFDADDWPAEDYIKTIFNNLGTSPDCLSLRGIMTTDGKNPEIFEHSLKYNEWKTNHINTCFDLK